MFESTEPADRDDTTPFMNGPSDPFGYGQQVPPVTTVGNVTVGFVRHIHGEDGRPVPEFVPTKHELDVIARHWVVKLIELRQWWDETGQSGSDEAREFLYARDRVDAIATLIGADRVRNIVEEVASEHEFDLNRDD